MMALDQPKQELFYSIGRSGGKACSASLKNFKVQASTISSEEEFEKSFFQEGMSHSFAEKIGGASLPRFLPE